ncbi:MAG: hypothetical protein PHR45_06545 [Muribaculaceae bacterium]|nr:hypothetical protein [Muribaculaceae bacterium]
MKKNIIFIAILIVSTLSIYGNEYNQEQIDFRSDLITQLRSLGYSPELDEDGDIYYITNEKRYYVEVSDKNTNPFYIVVSRYLVYGTTFDTRANLEANLNSLNAYKGVKALFYKDSYRVGAEVFIKRASMLNQTLLNKYYEQIQNVIDAIVKLPVSDTATSYNNSGSRQFTIDNVFPIYGYRLGDSLSKATNNGEKVTKESTYKYFFLKNEGTNYGFYDFNKTNDINYISMYKFPENLEGKLDISFGSSYNEWVAHLRNIYIIKEDKIEQKEFNGRTVLKAKISVEVGDVNIRFLFDCGNKNGEGYSVNSKNTLERINFSK